FKAGLEARAEMRSNVEDDPVCVDRARDLHRVAQRRAGLLVQGGVGRAEVYEVERVRDDTACGDAELGAAFLEAVEVGRVVVRRAPHARALREELHGVGADRLRAVERRVNTAGRGDMSAEEHGTTISRRPLRPRPSWPERAGSSK